jgi:hypothetical protein
LAQRALVGCAALMPSRLPRSCDQVTGVPSAARNERARR